MTNPLLIQAEVWYCDTPANQIDLVKEVCRRVGLELTATPEPVEPASGVWLLPVTPVVVALLVADGDLYRRLGTSWVTAEMP